MEERLIEAAQAGDINALYACIRQDPDVFMRFDKAEFIDTPLHIAAGRGHTDFAMAIIYLTPSFARKLNHEVFTPIHLALQNQHTETARRLLSVDKDLVRVKGKEGYTALHCVAESGTLDLLAQFLKDCPESIEDLTIRGETALHIAVQNNRLEALEILARWLRRSHLYGKVPRRYDLINSRDRDGNTVLHIAASNTQPQMIQVLLESKVDIKIINTSGFTALDIIDQNQTQSLNRETSLHILRTAEGRISYISFSLHKMLRLTITPAEELTLKVKNMSPDKISALLVVLTIILTASYQAPVSPPGGVWQGDPTTSSTTIDHYVATSIMDRSSFNLYLLLNLVAFMLTSLLTIALLQIGCSSDILTITIELLLSSLFCCFTIAWSVISPIDPTDRHVKNDGHRLHILATALYYFAALVFLEGFRWILFSGIIARQRLFIRFFLEM